MTVYKDIVWELIQLFEKFTCNEKFNQMMKNHKLSKSMLEISKDLTVSSEIKKLCLRIVKNVTGGGRGTGMNKIKS